MILAVGRLSPFRQFFSKSRDVELRPFSTILAVARRILSKRPYRERIL